MNQVAQSRSRVRTMVGAVLTMVLGGFVFVWLGALPALTTLAPSLFWREVPAQGASVKIAPVHGNWVSVTEYRYELDGKTYHGDRYAIVDPEDFMSKDELLGIQGGPTAYQTCFASRVLPSLSVLRARLPWRAFAKDGFIALVAAGAGALGYRRFQRARQP